MKIQPMNGPSQSQQGHQNSTQDARARAIAKLTQSPSPQPEQPIVQNQSQVTPEELSAIQPRQSNPVETQVEETTQEVTSEETQPSREDAQLSKQYAQLARQERALRQKAQQQEQALKAREAALAEREAKLSQQPQFDPKQYYTKDQVKQNALDILAEAGVSYEDLTQQILTQQPIDPRFKQTVDSLKQEIEALKSQNEESKKTYAQQQDAAYQAAIKQIELDANNLIKSDPVTFEAISKTGTVKEVVKLITETYHKDGVLLSVEEAAQQVEDYLVEENFKMASQIKKIQQKMQQASTPKASSSPAQPPAQEQKQPQPMKTLTNTNSSSRQLSAKERAILAFRGELKS